MKLIDPSKSKPNQTAFRSIWPYVFLVLGSVVGFALAAYAICEVGIYFKLIREPRAVTPVVAIFGVLGLFIGVINCCGKRT